MDKIVEMLLTGISQEFPHKPGHVYASPSDIRPARELTPLFYGCFDWHSAVHSHWALLRLLHVQPGAPWSPRVQEALDARFTPDALRAETAFLSASERRGFEVPYGLSWLLQLTAELHEMGSRWLPLFEALEAVARDRLLAWLGRLSHPIRSGEHSQSAFAMSLLWDWARRTGDESATELIVRQSKRFYLGDRQAPVRYEPSGHDFLSPVLAEADLMRRVLPTDEFQTWLAAFWPEPDLLEPVTPVDRSDGKFVHFDGLNLSRAWMLEGLAHSLADGDPRQGPLLESSERHGRSGAAALEGATYAGSHWLGSFAVYWLTRRGLHGKSTLFALNSW